MSVASRIQAIEEHIGNVYDTLDYAIDTTSENKNIVNIPKNIYNGYLDILKDNGETLFNNLPKVTGEGTSVTLNDTANAPMKMIPMASELEQETTTGKNLLDGANSSYTNYANSTLNNEIIKMSSTVTNTIPFSGWVFENLQANDVIRYSGIIQDKNGQIVVQYDNNGTWTSLYDMTSEYTDGITPSIKGYTNTDGYSKFRVLLYSSKTIPTGASESSYKNVIVTVNNSDMTYEPYTGGNPAPNPDYPQEIHTISGDNEIVVGNLINLLDWNKFIDFSNWSDALSPGYKKFQISGLKSNTIYTLCIIDNTGYNKGIYTGFDSARNNTNIFISSSDTTKNLKYISATSTGTGELYIVSSGISSQSSLDNLINSIIKDAWVIQGDTFIEPQEQTLPLNLGDLEYCKIGDYEDEFVIPDSEKNKLKGTLDGIKSRNTNGTWNDNVYTYNGVTFTVNSDLSVTIGGTFNSRAYLFISDNKFDVEQTSYILNGCPSGGSVSIYDIACDIYSDNETRTTVTDTGNSIEINTTSKIARTIALTIHCFSSAEY